MSRFTAMNKPMALPGACLVCRTEANGPFVDTGQNIPYHGAVYICKECLKEMYGLVRDESDAVAVSRAELRVLKGRLALDTRTVLGELTGRFAKELANVTDRITDGYIAALPGDPGDYADILAPKPDEDESGSEGSVISADDAGVETGDSDSVGGPADVSSDSGDGAGSKEPEFHQLGIQF